MPTKTQPFDSIIGQEALVEELEFHIEGYGATGMFPHSLLVAERGAGKSSLALAIGAALKKPFHEILAKDLPDTDAFFSYVVVPLLEGKRATVFFEEASLLSANLTHTFLRIADTRRSDVTEYTWTKNGQTYKFDSRKITFLFATSNPDKIDPDLADRLKPFTFDHYSDLDLARILQQHTVDISYEDGVLVELAKTLRNNPRNATLRARDIKGYVRKRRKKKFTQIDLEEISRRLHIMPLGLNKLEVQALRFINERPKTSLTTLAAKMHMTQDSLRQNIETRLLATSLIEVEPRGRVMTPRGKEILLQIDRLIKKKRK